jgi:hypothetical protein
VPRATHTSSSLGSTGGCMALAPHLRMVVWLHKFQQMGSSTPPSFCRSTPPPSSLQEGMRPSWYNPVLAREPTGGDSHLVARAMPLVHSQL